MAKLAVVKEFQIVQLVPVSRGLSTIVGSFVVLYLKSCMAVLHSTNKILLLQIGGLIDDDDD